MLRTFTISSFLLALFLFGGCDKKTAAPQQQIPNVVVDTAIERDVQQYIIATGYAAAYEYVDIPARVGGFLREIKYDPGDLVHAGQPLFLIEPDQYKASEQSAEATLASAKAELELAEANLARTKQLQTQGASTIEDLQTDQAKRNVAAAKVLEAEASLATAQLNLSYTDVRSPIFGKVDRNLVDVGNMVGANGSNTTLTSVAGMDPIYIYFEISDTQFNHIREISEKNQTEESKIILARLKQIKEARAKRGEKPTSPEAPAADAKPPIQEPLVNGAGEVASLKPLTFHVGLIKGAAPNKSEYPYQGVLDMSSNKIDKATGTIEIRGEIPNEKYDIYPGQICRIQIPTFVQKGAVLVKEEAVATDLNSKYVFVLDDKNVTQRRNVVLGELQSDNMRVIDSGIAKGERYVSVGISKARDGGEVKPTPPTEKKPQPETPANVEPQETIAPAETAVPSPPTPTAEPSKAPAEPVKTETK